MDLSEVMVSSAGASSLIAAYCRQLKIPQMIDQAVTWDEAQCLLSPGERIMALIINMLVDRKALYHVTDFFREQDCEVLFGKGVRADHFNDDALGRALDQLAGIDMNGLHSSICLSSLVSRGRIGRLHMDTTSISVEGAYEGEGSLNIVRGYSKDLRHDLNQIMMGLAVTPEGLPAFGQVLNGNQNDGKWYPTVFEKLRPMMSPEEMADVIFVGDAALVNEDNLNAMREGSGLQFISRLPETFKIVAELKEQARHGRWRPIGPLSEQHDAAVYRSQSYVRELYGHPYRFIVVHSTSLDSRKEKTLTRRWQKAQEELEHDVSALAKQSFACQADAEKAIVDFIKKQKAPFFLTGSVVVEQTTKHARRGRPAKDATPIIEEKYFAHVEVLGPDQDRMKQEKEDASTFILITSLLDEHQYADEEVLREYKEQASVEKRFRFLKSPFLVGPIYLKNKSRVEALAYVFLFALLVATHIEIRVREALKKEGALLQHPDKRKIASPTAAMLLELLASIRVVRVGDQRAIAKPVGPHVKRILELAGFDETIYTVVTPRQ